MEIEILLFITVVVAELFIDPVVLLEGKNTLPVVVDMVLLFSKEL